MNQHPVQNFKPSFRINQVLSQEKDYSSLFASNSFNGQEQGATDYYDKLNQLSELELSEFLEKHSSEVGFNYLAYDLGFAKQLITYAHILNTVSLDSVTDIFDVGDLLIKVRFLLGKSAYFPWLRAEFPFDPRLAGYIYAVSTNLPRSPFESLDNLSPSLLYFLAQPSSSWQCRTYVTNLLSQGYKITLKDFNLIRRFFNDQDASLPPGYPQPEPFLLKEDYTSVSFEWLVDQLLEQLLYWEFPLEKNDEYFYSLKVNEHFAKSEPFYSHDREGNRSSEILFISRESEYYLLEGKSSHLLFNGNFNDFLNFNFLSKSNRCLYVMFSYHKSEISQIENTCFFLDKLKSLNYYFRGYSTTVYTNETFMDDTPQQWMISALEHQLLTGYQVSFLFLGIPNKAFIVGLDEQLAVPSFIIEPNMFRFSQTLASWENAGKTSSFFVL